MHTEAEDATSVQLIEHRLHPAEEARALMVLFPGGGSSIDMTEADFPVASEAKARGISVLYMGFNRHIWIEDRQADSLLQGLSTIINAYGLQKLPLTLGGMSSGGNVAIAMAANNEEQRSLPIEGLFIVDSPIDLYFLYQGAIEDIARPELSEERLAEPRFIKSFFEERFGEGQGLLEEIQAVAPVTLEVEDLGLFRQLNELPIRLYTEPDTLWWMENRGTEFQGTNAYVFQQTYARLTAAGYEHVELIQTQGRGYRADGTRHPHSWSIVEESDLFDWVLQ